MVTKMARHLRYEREAKARERLLRLQPQVDPSLTVPQHLIDREDDDSEEGLWSGPIQCQDQWGGEGWAGEEESEEESEVTDREDDVEFNKNAFQKLLARASDLDAFSGQLRYHHRLYAGGSVRTQQRTKKRHEELRLAAMNCKKLSSGWLGSSNQTESESDLEWKPELTPEEKAL